jgi:MFS family permease
LQSSFDRRSIVVAGAFLVQAVTIGYMFAYGVFFNELEREFGWSRTMLSAASSIGFLSMGLLAVTAGRMNDRFGPRWVLTVTGLCTALAYLLMSGISEPWHLFAIYACLVGIGLATHDVVTLSTVARSYPNRRGMMTGIVKVGTATGQMLIPVLVVMIIAKVGWRDAFVVMGVAGAVLLCIAAYMTGADSDQHQRRKNAAEKVTGFTFAEARATPQLWLLCAMQFFFFSSLTTIPVHIVPHGIDSGMTGTAAATLLSTIAFSSIAGRLLVGFSADKLGGRGSYMICLLPLTLSLLSLVFIDQTRLFYVFAMFYGFAHGGLFTVVSPTIAEYFGLREHGAIFGTVVLFGTFGGATMPIIAGMIFDQTQSYQWAFTLLCAMAAISLLCATRLVPPRAG